MRSSCLDDAGTVSVRDSLETDTDAIARIYAHWVQHGLASFELVPPDANEIRCRRAATLGGRYPHIVATDDAGRVLGYAYAGPYRTRQAYRFACEDSVYVAPGARRKGIGRTLLAKVIARCEAIQLRLMIAIIGDSGNVSSIGLHRALGFTSVGVLPAIGWKHGRWVDSVLMMRVLGAGASLSPVDSTEVTPAK